MTNLDNTFTQKVKNNTEQLKIDGDSKQFLFNETGEGTACLCAP